MFIYYINVTAASKMKEEYVMPIKELKRERKSKDLGISGDYTDVMSDFLEK